MYKSLQLSTEAILAGFASGLISTAILVVNNLRDKETDKHGSENTLAVRFGATFVRTEYTLCFIVTGIITAYLSLYMVHRFFSLCFPFFEAYPSTAPCGHSLAQIWIQTSEKQHRFLSCTVYFSPSAAAMNIFAIDNWAVYRYATSPI